MIYPCVLFRLLCPVRYVPVPCFLVSRQWTPHHPCQNKGPGFASWRRIAPSRWPRRMAGAGLVLPPEPPAAAARVGPPGALTLSRLAAQRPDAAPYPCTPLQSVSLYSLITVLLRSNSLHGAVVRKQTYDQLMHCEFSRQAASARPVRLFSADRPFSHPNPNPVPFYPVLPQ